MMIETQCEPEQFQGRIIFMSMYNDIVWGEKENEELCVCEFPNRSRLCKNIRARMLVVSSARIRKEVVRNSYVQTEWKMGSCRGEMMINFSESGHLAFRGCSALARGDL